MDFRPSRTAAARLAGYPVIHEGPRPRPVPAPVAPADDRPDSVKAAELADLIAELDAIAAD